MSKLLLGMVIGVFVVGFAAELVTRKRRGGLPSFRAAMHDLRQGFMEGLHETDRKSARPNADA